VTRYQSWSLIFVSISVLSGADLSPLSDQAKNINLGSNTSFLTVLYSTQFILEQCIMLYRQTYCRLLIFTNVKRAIISFLNALLFRTPKRYFRLTLPIKLDPEVNHRGLTPAITYSVMAVVLQRTSIVSTPRYKSTQAYIYAVGDSP
jgi:hypothetical protein